MKTEAAVQLSPGAELVVDEVMLPDPSPRQVSVKLYSSGEIVGDWEAVGAVRVEGETFVFTVRDGVGQREVRIQGTFSYEVQP